MSTPLSRATAFLVLLVHGAAALLAQQTPSRPTALVGGRLIDGTGQPPIENAVVIMRGDRIVAAGPADRVSVPRDATVVRVDGKTVMPGMIESNGHVVFSGQANHTAYWAKRWPQYYEIGARNLQTNLMQGVTTIRDTMDPLEELLRLRAAVQAGTIAGSRLFVCGTILNYPGIHGLYGDAFKTNSAEVQALSPADVAKARAAMALPIRDAAHGREVVAQYAARGVDFIKVSAYSGPANVPPVLSTEALKEIVTEAHRHGLPVTTHTMTNESVQAVLDAGVDAMEHPELMDDATQAELPDAVVQQIVRQKVYSIPLIVAFEVYSRYLDHPSRLEDPFYIRNAPADMVQEAREWVAFQREANPMVGREWDKRYQLGRRNLKKLIAAGAPIAMGIDKGTTLNFHESANHVRELEIYVELGMSTMDAIVSATRRGAELLKKDAELGTIGTGKLADVIVIDGDPLERISALRNVEMVFKGGVRYK
ncbi:MAG: amidohydrolase family protein [Gemmatimonadales bacterium]